MTGGVPSGAGEQARVWKLHCEDCAFTKECDSGLWAGEARRHHESLRPDHNVWITNPELPAPSSSSLPVADTPAPCVYDLPGGPCGEGPDGYHHTDVMVAWYHGHTPAPEPVPTTEEGEAQAGCCDCRYKFLEQACTCVGHAHGVIDLWSGKPVPEPRGKNTSADLIDRAEAAEASLREAQAALAAHHNAIVLARTVGVSTAEAWGMLCPVCALASTGETTDGGEEAQQ